MKIKALLGIFTIGSVFFGGWAMSATVLTDMQSQREQAYKSFQEGNYKDAYDGYRKLAMDPNDDPRWPAPI